GHVRTELSSLVSRRLASPLIVTINRAELPYSDNLIFFHNHNSTFWIDTSVGMIASFGGRKACRMDDSAYYAAVVRLVFLPHHRFLLPTYLVLLFSLFGFSPYSFSILSSIHPSIHPSISNSSTHDPTFSTN